MKSSRRSSRPTLRGATRVSIAWLITFLVLFLISLVIAYVAFDSEAEQRRAAETAAAARLEAESLAAAESKALTELSRAVGFFDPAASSPRTDLGALSTAMSELRATFPDIKEDTKTLGDAQPLAQAAYNSKSKELAAALDDGRAKDSQMSTLQGSLQEALRQKDQQIADLQRQVQDQQANAAQKQAEMDGRVTALGSQSSQLDADLRQSRAQIEEQRRKYEDELATLQTRLKSMSEQLRFLQEPEAPDGRVLAVSRDLDLGWIDLGASNRLARGTTFRVVSGRAGSSRIKAYATVSKVEAGRAEVQFHGLADRFDPPVPGDVVYNPLYDPSGERSAVLAGRFSGLYNEAELKVLLEQMGIRVQDQLTLDTDYLLVGSELFNDPETGEPLEDPLPPSELSVYKDAEARGVLILPIKDLRAYFKL